MSTRAGGRCCGGLLQAGRAGLGRALFWLNEAEGVPICERLRSLTGAVSPAQR